MWRVKEGNGVRTRQVFILAALVSEANLHTIRYISNFSIYE